MAVGVDYIRATDYASLQAAVDAAALIPSKRLYMPAGVYGTAALIADDLDVFGDGQEKTIIQMPDSPSAAAYGIHMYGKRQSVEGLTVVGGSLGTGNAYGISATFGCSEWHLSDITVRSIAGVGNAGGSCFDFYQPSATDGGYSRGLGERLIAKDSAAACGFIINAQGNTFRDCKATACGNTSQRHGWYIQGGENAFSTCLASLSGGYSFHNYAAVPEREASYNTFTGCSSLSPIFGHFVSSSINNSAGLPLNRGVSLSNCLFRGGAANGLVLGTPALVSGCTFEDVLSGAGAWIGAGAGARVTGNKFGQTSMPVNQNIVGVVASAGALVSGNQVMNWLAGTVIRADGLSMITGNSLDLYGGIGLYVNGADAHYANNLIQCHGSARAYYGTIGVM